MMQKTGLFFGSFNPVHAAHVAIARSAGQHAALSEVWFVVTPQNPLKPQAELIDAEHRLAMVQLAVEPFPECRVCDIEFSLPQPHYTIRTLDALRQEHPHREWFLIIGADSWQSFPLWKEHQRLCEEYHLLVYPRPGCAVQVPEALQCRVREIPAPQMDISATHIREALKSRRPVAHLLPPPVEAYIEAHRLYR
jgi:nicotinate-nucleotide adenylyltransferase